MTSLFSESESENRAKALPLAARMRPRTLAEFVGQESFLGEGKLLRRLILADRVGSVIFFGPPGTGKTTLAQLLATETNCHFQQISAVTSGASLAPHERLPEILVMPREKIPTGAAARGNP